MKKIVSLLLILTLAVTAFGCVGGNKDKTLATPTGVQITKQGFITWQTVENATGYVVTVNGSDHAIFVKGDLD